MKKLLIFAVLLAGTFQVAQSQISSVNYALKYNSETCLFDAYIVANSGTAQNTLHRAQFNAQLTLVVPVASNVHIVESHMPLINNQNKSSNVPAEWEIANEIESPKQLPDNRLVSVIPELLPTAFYNDIKSGDDIKIFSFKVTPLNNCAKDVRLYDNYNDPGSLSKGMHGSDFRNGFTIGGVEQKYERNSATVYPSTPVIDDVQFSMTNEVSLDVNVSVDENALCQRSYDYTIYGPEGLIGSYDAFVDMDKQDIVRGEYKVVATDAIGCQSEASFFPMGEQSVTSVSEQTVTGFESSIFPVPAQNEVSLTMNGKAGTTVTGEIFNLDGKVVRTNVINTTLSGGEETISYETNLAPGMYNLSLTLNNSEKVNHKLLIIK